MDERYETSVDPHRVFVFDFGEAEPRRAFSVGDELHRKQQRSLDTRVFRLSCTAARCGQSPLGGFPPESRRYTLRSWRGILSILQPYFMRK